MARMTCERFDFAFARAYRLPGALFGVRPATAWVQVDESTLEARYGPWRVTTPRSNITRVAITGPYAYPKTAGPARLAITDRGLSFTPNGARGVLICFAEPVRGLDPFGVIRHPELTVGVAEPERLVACLNESPRP
jgi:hypothetical protein